MSLSIVLKDASSPLRRLLEAELPGTAQLRASYLTLHPKDLPVVRPAPPLGIKAASGTLNAAIDHRLRMALTDEVLDGSLAQGVRVSDSPRLGCAAEVGRAMREAGESLLVCVRQLIVQHQPADRGHSLVLAPDAEKEIARACFVAVLYEELYRTAKLWPGTLLGDAGPGVNLQQLLVDVPEYAVQDLCAVVALASPGLDGIRARTAPSDIRSGPTFAGSRDVGGADADWIADGLLVDVKATIHPEKLHIDDVRQLVGYVLLDYHDEYGILRSAGT